MATKKSVAKKAPAKKAVPAPAICSGPSKADEARWRAEADLSTLQRMAEIKRDPARLRAAEALIKQQLQAIQTVKGK